jgi:hypothetical protein
MVLPLLLSVLPRDLEGNEGKVCDGDSVVEAAEEGGEEGEEEEEGIA